MAATRRPARPIRPDIVAAIKRRLYLMQAACRWEDGAANPEAMFEAIYELTRQIEDLLPRLTDPKRAAVLEETT